MSPIRIAAHSAVGSRQRNEDALRHGRTANGHFAVLADGAGGHQRGAEAANRTVDCIERQFHDVAMAFSPANLSQMVRLAHWQLQGVQRGVEHSQRMHCTVVALWIDPSAERALWTHVGDSRLYRIRRGRVDVVTSDDSVVQRMMQSGMLSPEQARHHPHKNQLLAALGTEDEVEPHTVVRPVELLDGDAFLLCSDGWWDAFTGDAPADSLLRAVAPEDWLREMQATIERRALPQQDNYSAIAIWVGDPGDVTQGHPEDTVPRMRAIR